MREQVPVTTTGPRAAMGLLTLGLVASLPVFVKGQCKEPANPKAEVPASKLDGTKSAVAATMPSGIPQEASRYLGASGQRPAQVMMYKPPMTQVPDLSNKTLDEIKVEVANKLTIRTVNNNNPGWIVERQFPERYSNVAVCAALDLWMKAPPQQITRVPRIVGVPENQIVSLLKEYHLRYGGWTPKEATAQPGTIFDQDPEPGTPEPWGSKVIAYKATSPPPVVPLSVRLTANMTSVKPGSTVTFVAKLQPDSLFRKGAIDGTGRPTNNPPFRRGWTLQSRRDRDIREQASAKRASSHHGTPDGIQNSSELEAASPRSGAAC